MNKSESAPEAEPLGAHGGEAAGPSSEAHRSFELQLGRLIELLEGVLDFTRAVGLSSAAAPLEIDVLGKLRGDRFHLVVMGEFNHGKTSFVNALLGRSILPVGVTPTTALIHHVAYAQKPSAKLVYASGAEQRLALAELGQFAADRAGAALKPGEAAGGEGAYDPISHLELYYPADLLSLGVVLVDTPGVNDLSETRAEITCGYVPRSDAVLFLLDAGQPLKASERQFLQHQLLERSRDKIIFVVTKADIWSDREREQALSYIQTQLEGWVGSPQVFAVSAERELEAQPAEEQGLPTEEQLGSLSAGAGPRSSRGSAASGFPELAAHLTHFLVENRGRILLSNGLSDGERVLTRAVQALEARRHALALSEEQLVRRLGKLREQLSEQAGTLEERRLGLREASGALKASLAHRIERFREVLLSELLGFIETSDRGRIEAELQPLLERSFEGFLRQESEFIAAELELLSERTAALLNQDVQEEQRRLGELVGGAFEPPKLVSRTFVGDMSVLAVMSAGVAALFASILLGGALLVAGPLLALWHRERTERELKRQALEAIPQAIDKALSEVRPYVESQVENWVLALDAFLVSQTQSFGLDLAEALELLQRERGERRGGAAQELQALSELQERGAALEKSFAEFKAGFASTPEAEVSQSV